MQEAGPFDKTIIVPPGQNPLSAQVKPQEASSAAETNNNPAPTQPPPTASANPISSSAQASPIQLGQAAPTQSNNSCLKWTCGCGLGCLFFILLFFGMIYYFVGQMNLPKSKEEFGIKVYETLRDTHLIEEFLPKNLSQEEKKEAVKIMDVGVNCYKQSDETSKNQILEQVKAFSKKDPNSIRDLKDFFNKVPPSFNECLTRNGYDVPSIQNAAQ